MKRRILYSGGVVLLAILVTLVAWQGSFSLGWYRPETAEQTYLLWAVSTLIFILMVTLGFMLARTFVRLYIERRSNREGSRIRTKLVVGALALSITPVFFLVLWSIYVLNNNLARWFSRPAQDIERSLVEVNLSFERETQLRAQAQARWLAQSLSGAPAFQVSADLCRDHGIFNAAIVSKDGSRRELCSAPLLEGGPVKLISARVGLGDSEVVVQARMSMDLAARQDLIQREVAAYKQLETTRKETRNAYILLLVLISLFILFVATWIALFFSKQLSVPISALLEGAGQLRKGALGYRVQTQAIDELGTLVRAFNDMASELEANEKELERRHNFTEAILESIPTGVISFSAERRIQRVNRALVAMFGAGPASRASRIEDLFPPEDAREIHYLLNRARRTGVASAQLDLKQDRGVLHLAITVSALVGKHSAGWVVVLEDTSELLRAQKASAWHEVARRIAHEMKNPLTPISLSAERIVRQIEKTDAGDGGLSAESLRILRSCSLTIAAEVESVKTLVDEFSQFARFPEAQPAPADLNEVVENALAVFSGRLDGIEIVKDLSASLPSVSIDREQFKRVVVNLVDNAAEAMQGAPLKRLYVGTQMAGADTVELTVADTGHGISPEDRERLFLPYFSTRGRGTGLGLAIVHHILQEHGAQIRVEDNQPCGAQFVIEIPSQQAAESDPRTTEHVA